MCVKRVWEGEDMPLGGEEEEEGLIRWRLSVSRGKRHRGGVSIWT